MPTLDQAPSARLGSFANGLWLTKSAHIVDLNSDGQKDILVSFGFNTVAWFIASGGGAFGAMQSMNIPNASYVDAADVDGDGDEDILGAYNALILENDGSGSFVEHQGLLDANADKVRCEDVDLDGMLDVLFYGENGDAAYVLNQGALSFSAKIQIPKPIDSWDMMTSDLDEDGDTDILFQYTLEWYANDGSGVFWSQGPLNTDHHNSVVIAKFADVDMDGSIDVVVRIGTSSPYSGWDTLAWSRNLGGGLYAPQIVIDPLVPMGSVLFNVQDFDGDGDPDILSSSISDVGFHRNNGAGFIRAPRYRPAQVITSEKPAIG
ncbi:MAG: VCBS repeat-containing protein [Flavobacteriales bacterium]|nr:VCBS repeat-containing protein [Flavobacteriales bacterium]